MSIKCTPYHLHYYVYNFVFLFLLKAKENIGMVMIFTLVSAAQEWINERSDIARSQKIEIEEQRKKAEEEAERVI